MLKNLVPLYGTIMNEGTVEAKLKEFAYLKTSSVNGVRVLNPRAHRFVEAGGCDRRADQGADDRVTRSAAAIRDAALEDLKKHFNEQQIVELPLVIAIANFTNRFNDALRMEPDIG